MSSLTRKRLWWIAICAIFVACASAPATKTTKKKRKKKKKRDNIALKSKKKADRNDDEEKPDKPFKKKKDKEDDSANDDEVVVSDDDVTVIDDDSESEPAPKKKKKKADKKKEVADEEPPPPDEEEPPPKKKKPEKIVAAAKTKKADKKKKIEDEEPVADEPPPEEVDEPKPEKKKPEKKKPEKKKKKAEQVAAIDMTGSTPTETDEPTIDMEEESSGSSLDDRVEDAPPERRAVAIPVPGVDDDSDDTSVSAEVTPETMNPLSINDRPLTLPDGKLSVHGGLRVGVLTVAPMGLPPTSTTSTGFALGATYGLGPKSQVGFDYTLGVSPGSVKGPFTLHGAYTAVTGGKLDIAIAAALAIDPTDLVDPTTMMSTSNTYASLQIGAWARYRLTRKASLFTGLPALPTSAVSLTKNALSLPPQPYQAVIGLNNAGTIALDIPVGLGYQIKPNIYAFGVLELAHIRIANTVNAFIFDRFIPISLGGFYALDKLDIGATFTDDLKQGTDYLRFDTFVRYSIK